jgi:MFS family permease
LIRPFLGRFKPELLFFGGNCLAGLAVLSFLGLPSVAWLFPLVFLTLFFVSFVTPTSNTVVSNSAPAEVQGEAMGVLSSVNALALVLSPLFSGSLVGNHPSLPMWVGGALMLCVAIVGVSVFRKKLFH